MPAKVKIDAVAKLKDLLQENTALILVDYRGITAESMKGLKNSLRSTGVVFSVVKNNLFKIALKEAGLPNMDEFLTGPTAVVYSQTDLSLSAAPIKDASKKIGKLTVKGGVMDGSILNAEQVVKVADLPSREVLLSQLVGAIQGPISNFVFSTKGIISNLVYTLQNIKDSRTDAA